MSIELLMHNMNPSLKIGAGSCSCRDGEVVVRTVLFVLKACQNRVDMLIITTWDSSVTEEWSKTTSIFTIFYNP
jgi:hypothetical protein